MFLLVSFRHVGARPGGHQLGVSIQIPINLGKTFLLISRIRNNSLTRILASVFVYLTPFLSQILALNYWTVYIFIFDLCWMAWQWKPAKFIWLYKRPMLTDFNHNNGASSRWKALRNKFNLSGNFLSHCDVHVNIDVTMETEVKQLCFSKFVLSLKNRFYFYFY